MKWFFSRMLRIVKRTFKSFVRIHHKHNQYVQISNFMRAKCHHAIAFMKSSVDAVKKKASRIVRNLVTQLKHGNRYGYIKNTATTKIKNHRAEMICTL